MNCILVLGNTELETEQQLGQMEDPPMVLELQVNPMLQHNLSGTFFRANSAGFFKAKIQPPVVAKLGSASLSVSPFSKKNKPQALYF